MTYEFEYLMQLMAAASRGFTPAVPDKSLDWERLCALAREQSVEPLIGYVLKNAPHLPCPEDLRKAQGTKMQQRALMDYQRRVLHFRLMKEMEEAGIRAVLLKGYDAARFYAVPECRISTDLDLWIDPGVEKQACRFMESRGFVVEPRWTNGHHAVCHHPRMGCVELHVLLYDEIVESVWYGKKDGREFIQEDFVRVDTPDGAYWSLGDTDNLLFLSLHMIKHFIMSGMSLRILMDVALFFAENKEKLDSTRFWNTMRELRYERLMQCILWTAVEHFSFDREDFPGLSGLRPPQIPVILEDLEQGGWLGFNDKTAREDGWYEYNHQLLLRDRKPWQYKLYMLRWRMDAVWSSLRPTRTQLEKEFSYMKGRPWLYPIGWLHKLGRKAVKFLRHGLTREIVSAEEKMSDSGRKRLALFKELGML